MAQDSVDPAGQQQHPDSGFLKAAGKIAAAKPPKNVLAFIGLAVALVTAAIVSDSVTLLVMAVVAYLAGLAGIFATYASAYIEHTRGMSNEASAWLAAFVALMVGACLLLAVVSGVQTYGLARPDATPAPQQPANHADTRPAVYNVSFVFAPQTTSVSNSETRKDSAPRAPVKHKAHAPHGAACSGACCCFCSPKRPCTK